MLNFLIKIIFPNDKGFKILGFDICVLFVVCFLVYFFLSQAFMSFMQSKI
jgi:hypothetical protein